MIPIRYNLRSLMVRRATSLMTAVVVVSIDALRSWVQGPPRNHQNGYLRDNVLKVFKFD